MRTPISAAVSGAAAAAVVAAALTGCGSSNGGSASGGVSSPATMELILGTKSDDFYVTMECGAKAEAKKLGVKLTVTGPASFSAPQQKPLIDSVQVTKPDALIVAPTDEAALDSDLLKVQRGGTKVVFVDTAPASTAFAANVITAQGAASGISHAAKKGKIKLATFDADPTQMSMMRSGAIQLAIAQE